MHLNAAIRYLNSLEIKYFIPTPTVQEKEKPSYGCDGQTIIGAS
jgi:hypothetical protein